MPKNEKITGIFIALQSTLARAVSSIVPPKEIEDIVQETYVRVCQVENTDTIAHPRSFLLKIAKNLALDYVKRAETRLVEPSKDETDDDLQRELLCGDATYNSAAANQEFAHFCESVRQLPLQCRKVFVLKKVYGYSQKEIAVRLDLSESTVEKHIATGIKKCTLLMASRQHPTAPATKMSNDKIVSRRRDQGGHR